MVAGRWRAFLSVVAYCSKQSINKHWNKYRLVISLVSIAFFYVLLTLYPASTLVRMSTNKRLISLIAGAVIVMNESRMSLYSMFVHLLLLRFHCSYGY
jgi:putative effector of murein hydrolase